MTQIAAAGRYFNIQQGGYFSLGLRAFTGFVLALLTVAVYYFPWVLVLYLPGLFIIFCPGGVDIDFDKKRMRNYMHLGDVKIGTWHPLPDVDYISLYRAKEKFQSRSSRVGRIDTHHEQKYKVCLVYDERRKLQVYVSLFYEKAFDVANELAERSGLRIFVVNGKEKAHWLE